MPPGSPACDQRPRDRDLDKSDKSHIASLTHYLDHEGHHDGKHTWCWKWSYSEQKRNIIGLSIHDNDSDFLEVQGLEKGTWRKMIFDFLPPNLFYASVHFVLILLQGYRPPSSEVQTLKQFRFVEQCSVGSVRLRPLPDWLCRDFGWLGNTTQPYQRQVL